MSEPVTATLGVKLGTLVAGFAGGVVSLAFVQGLTRLQAARAVLVGTLTAAYLTPIGLEHFHLGDVMQNGAAFVIGLCAMSIIPALKRAVARRVNKAAGSDDAGTGDGGEK